MIVKPGLNKYEVVLANQYYLRELVETIALDESLSDISYHGQARIVVTPDFQKIGINKGQAIRVSGIPFGGTGMVYLLHPAVVWTINSNNSGQKHLDVDIYDQTIYLSKSEEEYLFAAGMTATERLYQYAKDWGITIGSPADTGITLAKAVYRAQSLWSMIQSDLKETASKGGPLYRARMMPNGLELVKLGSNPTVWVLEPDQNVEEINQKRSLEGAITKVKVVGNAGENERSPVLAVESGNTAAYGTLQKILQDEKITTAAAAKEAAQNLLYEGEESFSVQGIDINTIRAGDKVIYLSSSPLELYVASVTHNLGSPGHMTLELAWEDGIRRQFYG